MDTLINYGDNVGERKRMQENQDGGKMPSISILKLKYVIKHAVYSTLKLWVNIFCYVFNIFCFFRLIIYVLYSFNRSFSTFYVGLLSTHTVARVNTLSRE